VELVLATLNRDKARELEAILAGRGFRIRPLADFPGAVAPEENGGTLLANARLKADAAVRFTGRPALADDTGLEVDALDGAPGPFAARFAGPRATYAQNVALLLARLDGVPRARRTARFRTVCVARFPDGGETIGEGVLEGFITEAPRGRAGFGYDPVFEILGSDRTLAELRPDEKNAVSHRARAARALADRLAAR
jgi:XTP/dITP diphosphohydrolase